jgi:hypothetical protein
LTRGPLSQRAHLFRFPWEELYAGAVLETNDAQLEPRIKVAEDAMMARRDALMNAKEDDVELCALQEALYDLTVLNRERVL